MVIDTRKTKVFMVTEKEENLIKFIREIGYAEFILIIKEGQPVLAREPIKNRTF